MACFLIDELIGFIIRQLRHFLLSGQLGVFSIEQYCPTSYTALLYLLRFIVAGENHHTS